MGCSILDWSSSMIEPCDLDGSSRSVIKAACDLNYAPRDELQHAERVGTAEVAVDAIPLNGSRSCGERGSALN